MDIIADYLRELEAEYTITLAAHSTEALARAAVKTLEPLVSVANRPQFTHMFRVALATAWRDGFKTGGARMP